MAKRVARDERGAVLVVVGVLVAVLLAAGALVIDVGMLYRDRRQLQTAVDAGALAAAMDISEGRETSAAESTARDYVGRQSPLPPQSILVDFPAADQVSVTAEVNRTLWLARAFGRDSSPVRATASARFGPAGAVNNLLPILVPVDAITGHVGPANPASFELGADRPKDPFSKTARVDGNTVTFDISYVNSTPKAEDITITDPVPEGSTYVSGSATAGGSLQGGSVVWAFAGVSPGDSRQMSFAARYGSNPSTRNTAYLDTSGSGRRQSASVGDSPQRGYFWLGDFDGGSGGVPQYDSWIRYGYPKAVGIGHIANGEGMKASLRDAVEYRMATNAKVLLPLYDYTEGGGSPGRYHVVGFAEFVVQGEDLTGNPKAIRGYFTDGTVAAGVPAATPVPNYFGVDVLWLSR